MDASPPQSTFRAEMADGWRVLLASFLGLAICWNFVYAASGLFLKPMGADFGWSRTELSFGPIVMFFVAFSLPVTAIIIDRYGPRRVALFGICALASALLIFAVLPQNHLAYYAAVLWLACAASLCNNIVFARGVLPWFPNQFGTAIGLMSTGSSVGVALSIPLIAEIIQAYGWRAGFVFLGISTLVIGLPLNLLWFHDRVLDAAKTDVGSVAKTPLRDIARTKTFWILVTASAVAALPIGGFLAHLQPMLTDMGISVRRAAFLGTIAAITVGVGKVVIGALLDRFHAPSVTSISLMVAASGVVLLILAPLFAGFIIPVTIAISLITIAQGAEGDYITYFSMKLYGVVNFSRVLAVLALVITVGMSLGGIAFSWVFDAFGSYRPAIYASAILYAVGGLIFLFIRMTPALPHEEKASSIR